MFFRKKSVASIMSSFTKQVTQLRALCAEKATERDRHFEKAAALREAAVAETDKGIDANIEAGAAARMANKIEAFITE